uniref:XK-related protein n=1 Tax=Neogobius melanostomus TaxID=47308 RepID=A0A8C6ULZ1_9GOBI
MTYNFCTCEWNFSSLRYFHSIYLGLRSRQTADGDQWRYHWRMVYEFADSAPQLVLQLCIIIQTHKLMAVQGMTAAASLVSLAWALASYQKALRESRDDKRPMSYLGVCIQFCWHFFTMAARVVTFALFASVFQLYFGLFIVVHWCIMTFWIVHCETDYCISKWEEIVFDMVVGIIYIFSWFNVKEGRTRCRLFIYYLVILVENTALSTLWYLYRVPYKTDAFAVPPSASSSAPSSPAWSSCSCTTPSSTPTGRASAAPQRAGAGPGPHGAVLHAALGRRRHHQHQLPALQPRRLVHAGEGEVHGAGRVRAGVPGAPHGAVHAVVSPAPARGDGDKDRPVPEQVPGVERHVLDRSIRKAILAVDCSLTPPRLQYKDDAMVQERLEYETTL